VRVLVIHGPNLSLLGRREPSVYGTRTLHDVDTLVRAEAAALGVELTILQTNHEGAIIDALIEAVTLSPSSPRAVDGVILNAGAYAHTSLAIADAVRGIAPVPVIEVHLTNTAARALSEPVRAGVVVGAACTARVEGLGAEGYVLALRALRALARRPNAT
jgi:3-dehydroquinate dehydratase-2